MIPRMNNPFIDLIIDIIEKHKITKLSKLLKEFNEYVFRGEMLCTTMDMISIGEETFPACRSVLLVIDYLATCGYIDIIDSEDGDKIIISVR